jgi:hypothetical protein
MPSINIPIGSSGPLVLATVGISIPRQAALQAAGLPAPSFVQGQFLIDTGATSSCVDSGLIAKLGLTPTGSVSIHTPSTNGIAHACNQYDIMMFIPISNTGSGCLIEAVGVIETSLSSQGIDGLIGRDLLDKWTCVYNGSMNIFTICY